MDRALPPRKLIIYYFTINGMIFESSEFRTQHRLEYDIDGWIQGAYTILVCKLYEGRCLQGKIGIGWNGQNAP